MLRRSQKSLDLPEKTDHKVYLNFDDDEQIIYRTAKEKTLRSINNLINSTKSKESYLNALQKINALRLICNLGTPTIMNHEILPQALQSCPTSSYEKCIVFSSWKSTLDLARSSLREHGIRCVQVDGRVKPKQREQIFHDFTHHEDVRVLLLSLACGSSGLTLTAASRVYLMEPQWNPSTEEQAMARVYRIGQTRNVTTIRYIMNNSIEMHVLAIQNGKKDLITLLLSGTVSTSKKLTKQRLMELKELL
ncbi:P-loop containing nucleoside triphosphate hydrolase protein [Xylariaceae sp. FL0255]|nr:P-loop containing nucleoside triphosphate hydrolase protein [Xylariaceae sp. FL0255]